MFDSETTYSIFSCGKFIVIGLSYDEACLCISMQDDSDNFEIVVEDGVVR